MTIASKINHLKKIKNAIILAHFYQMPEIQDIADYVDDSLGLSQKASETDADIIVFAGVHFMAETAKIINPDKKVLLPDINAGCSLADYCKPEDLIKLKNENPDHVVVTYINSSAGVKKISDIICTSSNAVDVVNSIPEEKEIIFVPDKNLGNYVKKMTGRKMIIWNGVCKVHDNLTAEKIFELKQKNSDAKIIAHPECKDVILEMADFVGSTSKMIQFVKRDNAKKYIVATETGILHQMKKIASDKEFIIVTADEFCSCNDCEYMKMITLEKILNSLETEKPEIILSEETINKARIPILKMLELSKKTKD